MGVPSTLLLLLFGIAYAFSLPDDLSQRYDFQLDLEFHQPGAAPFQFFYTHDRDNQVLKMAVKVMSLGWVGIGFSRNQFMTDTDIAIGWVDDSGEGFLQDRYASARALPRLDQQQDLTLINATEEDGHTIIEMERPLETCDGQDDFTLNVGDTIYLLYAYHPMDPTGENDILQHRFRQSLIINLFGSIVEPPVPSDALFMDVTVKNVNIPSADTTYWCTTQRIPQNIIDETYYITSMEPLLQGNTSDHVHHMLIYKCSDLTNSSAATSSSICDHLHEEADACRSSLLIGGWAVGAGKFSYPENVAYPIGGERGDKYLLIEIHYDNPNMESDNIDSSGMRFTLTRTPRQHNAGILGLGSVINTNMFIPPNVDQFNAYGYCPSSCTNQLLPPSGVTVFASFLHTHTIGNAVALKHVRNGEELPPVDQNLHYDFNYQLSNHIAPRVLMPGDDLIVDCRYNSSGRTKATFGGESTKEEMCLSFVYYYPEIPYTYCVSSPNTDQYEDWVQEYALDRLDEFKNVSALGQVQDLLESINYTDDALRDLESMNRNGIHLFVCAQSHKIHQPPQITRSYQPPDACAIRSDGTNENGNGDDDLDSHTTSGTVQLIYSTAAITFLVLITMLS